MAYACAVNCFKEEGTNQVVKTLNLASRRN